MFQFALPRGERLVYIIPHQPPDPFQFALPRGERRSRRATTCAASSFQFALPRGERPRRGALGHPHARFQFALPRGERRPPCACPCRVWRFNSRSREGSDSQQRAAAQYIEVSIRAPARGATDASFQFVRDWDVSIRAPARGATAIIGWQVLSGISQRRALACQQGTGG